MADEHRYDEWEALWADQAVYWVPAGDDNYDPREKTSIIYDNRSRIRTRVKQLKTGKRYSQEPPSRMSRVISNIRLEEETEDTISVRCNFILSEVRVGVTNVWSGRVAYKLLKEDGGFKIAFKKIMLVDNAEAVPTLSFLI